MKLEVECPMCRQSCMQVYKRVTPKTVLVITECLSKECNWRSAITVQLVEILENAPSIGLRIEHYGILIKI